MGGRKKAPPTEVDGAILLLAPKLGALVFWFSLGVVLLARRLVRVVLAVVVGAILVAGALFAGRNIVTSIQTQQVLSQRCTTETAYAAEHGSIITAKDGIRSLAVIGDSYATGEGLADRTKGWAYLLGQGTDWKVSINGFGGSGFVNAGPCGGQVYADRVNKVLSLKPQVLIIEGGLNDVNSPASDVKAGASLVLGRVREVPTVIVVGPTNPPSGKDYSAVEQALSEAAQANGRQYVSAHDLAVGFLPDKLHMTEAGHQTFAAKVKAALPS
jgi:acyl-CoA thioesterase-1